MRVRLAPDAKTAGEIIAAEIADTLARNPSAAIGVATGTTPEPVYEALAESAVDLSAASAFALDEYVGLPAGHPQSYRAILQRMLVETLGLADERLHVPDGTDPDPAAAAASYERALVGSPGVDLQLLGIGRNGHIGFNEPGAAFDTATRVVRLTDDTRRANSRFFADEAAVPARAITQGLGTIFRARRLVLLATTTAKAHAIASLVRGPITTDVPATLLRLHPDATVFVTPQAAAELTDREVETA